MRVQLAYPFGGFKPNDIIDVAPSVARRLLRDGRARTAPPPTPQPKPEPIPEKPKPKPKRVPRARAVTEPTPEPTPEIEPEMPAEVGTEQDGDWGANVASGPTGKL